MQDWTRIVLWTLIWIYKNTFVLSLCICKGLLLYNLDSCISGNPLRKRILIDRWSRVRYKNHIPRRKPKYKLKEFISPLQRYWSKKDCYLAKMQLNISIITHYSISHVIPKYPIDRQDILLAYENTSDLSKLEKETQVICMCHFFWKLPMSNKLRCYL